MRAEIPSASDNCCCSKIDYQFLSSAGAQCVWRYHPVIDLEAEFYDNPRIWITEAMVVSLR